MAAGPWILVVEIESYGPIQGTFGFVNGVDTERGREAFLV